MGVKLHIFGCLSGTEPMPGMHHTAWAIEYDGGLYWFDAGENGHRTAHLMGLDLLSIRTIAISHPHIDHCGGLLNLLCAMRKLQWLKDRGEDFDVRMMLPEVKMWDCARELLNDHDNALARAEKAWGAPLRVASDGSTFEL